MNLKDALNNVSYTENGMVGYKTTNCPLIDFNYKVSSYRAMSDEEIIEDFKKILHSNDRKYALRFLFFCRDIKNGLGERRLFRACLKTILDELPQNEVKDVLNKVKNFGRFDDLLSLIDTKYEQVVLEYIKESLESDISSYQKSEPLSLLAKWLPSINASSPTTIKLALKIAKYLNLSNEDYRKTLASLRKALDVVEVKICNNEWDKIDYSKVPSNANLKYYQAFMRHDEMRRQAYIESLQQSILEGNTDVKINATNLMPHEIVRKIMYEKDQAQIDLLSALWSNLKDIDLSNLDNTLVVRDGSGSMLSTVGSVCPITVATALAIYTSERLTGAFKDCFITFSSYPEFVDLSACENFHQKIKKAFSYDDCSNTDIQKVFELILAKAIEHKTLPSELPQKVIIISDMEFDYCASSCSSNVFEVLKEKYEQAGYKLPQLVFWNVCSRTNTIPCIQNDLGVILVSGFSQNVLSIINTGKDNSYESLLQILDSPRYSSLPLLK